jgi:SAM-dependent methyltransferase
MIYVILIARVRAVLIVRYMQFCCYCDADKDNTTADRLSHLYSTTLRQALSGYSISGSVVRTDPKSLVKSMLSKIERYYIKKGYQTSFISIFTSPYFLLRRGIFKGIKRHAHYMQGTMLDFGCGSRPYEEILNVEHYIGLDIAISGHDHKDSKVDFYYDGKKIPFDDCHFDSVFSSEVFDHVFNLHDILREMFRVLKPKGYLLATVPFVWNEHEVPYDFGRYTSFGLRHIMERAGFEIVKLDKSTTYIETVFQMWNSYVSQVILPDNKYIKAILVPLIVSPLSCLGIVLSAILPDNETYYHNSIVVAQKPK